MAVTVENGFQEIPTGAVEWPALINDMMNKVEAGRTLKLVAGEALVIGDPFYIDSTSGKAMVASNTSAYVGIWQSTSTATDESGYGQLDGTMTLTVTGSVGDMIYVTSAGALSTTSDITNNRPVAYIRSATVIGLIPAMASNDNSIRIDNSFTPASASASGVAGTICWDNGNLYVCVATDTWLKTTIATW